MREKGAVKRVRAAVYQAAAASKMLKIKALRYKLAQFGIYDLDKVRQRVAQFFRT